MSESPQENGGTVDARQSETAARLLHPVDTALSVMILAAIAYLWYETTQFEEVSFLLADNLPPATFPRILLVTIALMTALMPFEHILLKKRDKDIDKDRRDRVKPLTWATIVLLLAIMGMSSYLGTFLTMLSVCLLVPVLWGERRLRVVVPFAILFPALVTLVFNVGLGVFFEPGIFGIKFQ